MMSVTSLSDEKVTLNVGDVTVSSGAGAALALDDFLPDFGVPVDFLVDFGVETDFLAELGVDSIFRGTNFYSRTKEKTQKAETFRFSISLL